MDPIRVLVVEDRAELLRLLQLSLGSAGMQVVAAVDGEDALEKLAEARPDVLLTDLMMPRVDGLQLVLRIRETPGYEDLPVLLLTALPEDERSVMLAALPRTKVVGKPPLFGALVPLIAELVGRPIE